MGTQASEEVRISFFMSLSKRSTGTIRLRLHAETLDDTMLRVLVHAFLGVGEGYVVVSWLGMVRDKWA